MACVLPSCFFGFVFAQKGKDGSAKPAPIHRVPADLRFGMERRLEAKWPACFTVAQAEGGGAFWRESCFMFFKRAAWTNLTVVDRWGKEGRAARGGKSCSAVGRLTAGQYPALKSDNRKWCCIGIPIQDCVSHGRQKQTWSRLRYDHEMCKPELSWTKDLPSYSHPHLARVQVVPWETLTDLGPKRSSWTFATCL